MTTNYSQHSSFPFSIGSAFQELRSDLKNVACYIYLGYKENSHNPHHFLRINRLYEDSQDQYKYSYYFTQFSLHFPRRVIEKRLTFSWWEKDDLLTHVRPTSSTLKSQKERNVIKNAARIILNKQCPSIPFHVIRSEILSYI